MGSGNQNGARADVGREDTNSRAGWVLLGAAVLLAVGSVVYNVIDAKDGEAPVMAEADDQPDIAELTRRAEMAPDDADPWSELAYAHFERGEFSEAVAAYERAVAIAPDAAVLWSALGEARLMASDSAAINGEPLPAIAAEAFAKALTLDPTDPRARYFNAVKKDLDGDPAGAISSWLDLLADTPPGAPWEQNLIRTIQQVGAINEIDVEQRLAAAVDGRMPVASAVAGQAAPNLPGPSAQDLVAAGSIPPDEQRNMAEGMVARLEARLQSEPGNLDGWVMLMRSRMTLGQPAKAKAALKAAIAANPNEAEELRRQARQLGVD